MKQYDVIVVGAGNGGLVAAAAAAKAGFDTLVLEKHNLPGGCATSFVRGRFEFEPSLHELCFDATSEKQLSVRKVFESLGVDVPLIYEDNLFRVICRSEDGYDARLKSGYDAFLDSIEAAVPGCRESVKKYIDLIGELDGAQDYMDENGINPVVLFRDYGDFLRAGSHPADDIMNAIGIPKKAQYILNTYWGYLGVPADELNALHYISLLAAFIKTPPCMPRHKSHELSLALVKRLQELGGEIRYNSEVTRFVYDEKGAAIGVEAGGETLYAKKIISNIIPNNVFNRSDECAVPAQAKKLANARKLGMTFITVYLGLDCTMEELGMEDYSIFITNDPDSRKQYDRRLDFGMYVVNCLNKVVPDSSPEGTCTLFFTLPFMPGDFPDQMRPDEYKKWKNEYADKYIRDFETVLGLDVRSHIEEISIATPATFARYLGTPDGCIYGYANQSWDTVVSRSALKDTENKIKNLHFCGGHGIRGDGYPSGYMTGWMAAENVIRELKEGK